MTPPGPSPPLWLFEGEEEEGFCRFLAVLPPALAALIAPLPAVGLALAWEGSGDGGGGNGNGNASPQAAITRLIGAIEVREDWRGGVLLAYSLA